MRSFPARFLIGILVFIGLLVYWVIPPTVQAQQTYTSQSPLQAPLLNSTQVNALLNPNTTPDVPQNLNTFTQSVVINLMTTMVCQLSGINFSNQSQACLGMDPATGNIGFVPSTHSTGSGQQQIGGAIGVATNLISATFTPPASAREYFAYIGDKFGVVPKAYAQGTGLAGIAPIVKIWEAFRNITYLLFVIIFVAIGFAIMLRVKIDPRTVMTIQNSIPKIIIALIIVTFSFAIAGFVIDLMYVAMYLVYGLMSGIPGANLSAFDPATLQGKNVLEVANGLGDKLGIFGFVGTMTSGVLGIIMEFLGLGGPLGGFGNPSVANGLIHLISTGVGVLIGWIVYGSTPPFVAGTTAGSVINLPQSLTIGAAALLATETALRNLLPNLLAFIIIFTAVAFALFRLWFALISAYIWVLIDIVLAPLWILGGILPGSPISFSAWLRDIFAQLSAFPATLFMFMLGKMFIEQFTTSGSSGAAFVPPLIGSTTADMLGALIGFGIILLTPQVVQMVKDALKAPKFPYGVAVGQAMGAGAGAFPGVVGGASQVGSTAFGLGNLPKVGPVLRKWGFGTAGHTP